MAFSKDQDMAQLKDNEMAYSKRLNDEFGTRLDSSKEEISRAMFKYSQKDKTNVFKRRRDVLKVLMKLVQSWREMSDNTEVVLGTGEQIDHEPLHKLINMINWSRPSSGAFALFTKELTGLMQRVNDHFETEAKQTANDVDEMERELIKRGLLQATSDSDTELLIPPFQEVQNNLHEPVEDMAVSLLQHEVDCLIQRSVNKVNK